jgi:YegS/Rv2252/BmrU family lipid kinase
LVLVNPRSGLHWSFGAMRRAMDETWEPGNNRVYYQFCQGVEDGMAKARRAVEDGVDTILVAGGDGTVNTIGQTLIGRDVMLGIIPVGSGNGFARHFGIPLTPPRAVRALANAEVKRIDVAEVNGRPCLVTCSMAWDAQLVRAFERMPVRGILPYVFAGVQEFFEYRPQTMRFEVDDEVLECPDPMVCTVANLSEYGGGARIAPQARPDDGFLELVLVRRRDTAKMLANTVRFFDGSISRIPEVVSRRFKRLTVRRDHAAAIQVDGELVEAPAEIEVHVNPGALQVLVPVGE